MSAWGLVAGLGGTRGWVRGGSKGASSLFCVFPWARKIPGVHPGNAEASANNGK